MNPVLRTLILGIAAFLSSFGLSASLRAGDVVFVNGFQHAPAGIGGSNYHWYHLGPNCDREPYGVLANYHQPGVRAIVLDQLLQMRARGQQRIATGVIHLRAPVPSDGTFGGTLLDSTGGNLRPQYRQNLTLFLADIRDAGFVELLFRYFPQGPNSPTYWTEFSEDLYQENWNLIFNLEPLLQQSGLDYRTDLAVEGMPRARIIDIPGAPVVRPNEPANAAHSAYARRLWREYVSVYGHERSIGFSFVSDTDRVRTEARVRHMPYIYTGEHSAGVFPTVLGLDIYGTANLDEATIFRRHDQHMRTIPGLIDTPWIIAESYYDDAAAADHFITAMNQTARPVLYFTQWPYVRGDSCGAGVNVAPPEHFDQYRRRGF